MAKIHCAISGITFNCDHLPIALSNTAGYFHPVFALPYKRLLGLYSKHCQGHLTSTDSYLLFCAFLHSTGQVNWEQPASCNPASHQTTKLVENNISQLIRVIEVTNTITIPSFSQPSFTVASDNSALLQVPNWIKAWKANIQEFRDGYRQATLDKRIEEVEKKLTYLIISPNATHSYVSVIADWAAKTAEFPKDKIEGWKKTIRACFNSEKMFSTPLAELREIKTFCENNIEPGSIHFHKLYEVLQEGIARHTDFLGMRPEALGYSLLPIDATAQDAELESIIMQAPISEPTRLEYPDYTDYIKAKLRYRLATRAAAKNATVAVVTSNLPITDKETI